MDVMEYERVGSSQNAFANWISRAPTLRRRALDRTMYWKYMEVC